MKTDIQKVFDDMWKTGIGVDSLIDAHRAAATAMTKMSGFPPYNIRKTGENTYQVELAVAGFTIADIEITLEKNVMTISSKGHDPLTMPGEFIHQGFAYRGFDRKFTLMDNVKVLDAELLNGILKVYLEKMIPEEEKPKRININAPAVERHPQLLNESSSF
jgi:molecular chaperone IbpA